MNKLFIMSVLLLLSLPAFSDASLELESSDKTFLLTAPGTLSGRDKQAEKAGADVQKTLPDVTPRIQPRRRYKYVGENKRFRQFGQEPGQNNPWFDKNYSAYPQPSTMLAPPMANPWQLGGMPSPSQIGAGAPPAMSSGNSRSMYPPGQYSNDNKLFPDFPDGIYRDTNPAAFSLPGQNGFMPGMGGNNFGFPFSPFDMF